MHLTENLTRLFCSSISTRWIILWMSAAIAVPVASQTVQSSPGSGYPIQPGSAGGADTPQTHMTPIAQPPAPYQPPSGYGSFDPYATTNPSAASTPIPGVTGGLGPGVTTIGPPTGSPTAPTMTAPSLMGSGSLFGQFFSQPASSPLPGYGPNSSPSIYGTPAFGAAAATAVGIAGPPDIGGFPSSVYPSSTPNTMFPQGLGTINYDGLMQNPGETYSAYRLLQGPRFRYTFVGEGSKPNNLGINDFDTSVVFAFPNFLFLTQPVYVVPSFSVHLWSGPDGNVVSADLPSKAYSAFVDTGWISDPTQMFGTEFGLRIGGFSDFDTWNSRSFRVMGRALVNFRLTPQTNVKGGLYYVNRFGTKIVPAFGFECRPNPHTKIDIYFPKPKFARYCRTIGTRDLWWYATGDYGGGSWTIQRTSGQEESIDINDLRAVLGLEWGTKQTLQIGRRAAFAEIGYVFNRQVRYRSNPADDYDPKDSIAFRIGIGY